MEIKKFRVSVYVGGEVTVGVHFNEVRADSIGAAISSAVGKVYVSGLLSPRACALLKEAVKAHNDRRMTIYKKSHGVEVYALASENNDEDEGK